MLQQKAPGQGGGGAYPGILTKSLIDRGSQERGFNIEEGPTREAFFRSGGLLQRLRLLET